MIGLKTEFVFHFFRHGQSEDNANSEIVGTKDAQITPLGLRQAKALGLRLSKEGIEFDRMYSSPLLRVVHTTKAVCANISFDTKKIIFVPALEELDQGVLAGTKRAGIYTGDLGRLITYLGPWFRPPGGESQKMVQRRVSEWFEMEILHNEEFLKSDKVLNFGIFGSGMVFKCLFMDIMGFDASLLWKIRVDNCSISRFRFNHKGWFIDCVNDTGHLLGVS